MSELFHQLGIDWKLLLSQGVNFGVLIVALTFLVWRPLLRLMEERRKKIELGIYAGDEAKKRLAEIDKMKLEKIGEAEAEALEIMKKSELESKVNSQEIIKDAEKKSKAILKEAHIIAEKKAAETNAEIIREAQALIKSALIKTVGLRPEAVDDALIKEAITKLKTNEA